MEDYDKMLSGSHSCLLLNITTRNGIWQSDNPFIESIPHFVTQLTTILLISRTLFFIIKPLNQPRIVADVIGGILLGPSAFGRSTFVSELFPTRTVNTVETFARLALILHMFFVGLQTDLRPILNTSKKAAAFVVVGFICSISAGIGIFLLTQSILDDRNPVFGCIYWAVALTITSFPISVQILNKFKLMQTEIGILSMRSALLSDLLSWIVFAIALPICFSPKNAPLAVTATIAFIVFTVYIIRPVLVWTFRRTSNGHSNSSRGGSYSSNNNRDHSQDHVMYNEFYLCFVLIGAVICSFFTGVFGTHQVIGAYVFGLILPGRELRLLMMERFDDFVSGIMMPIFFVICGSRINILEVQSWFLATVVVTCAVASKVLGSIMVSKMFEMPPKEGLIVGLTMNTKGVLALIVFNVGWDKQVLNSEDYAIMIIAVLTMTMVVGPVISTMYRVSRASLQYKQRTLQKLKPSSELRIVTCIHSFQNVSGIVNLLENVNTKKKLSLHVFALHLVELTGRSSAMLIVHNNNRRISVARHNLAHHTTSPSDQIVNAFENLESRNSNLSVNLLTAVSPYDSMHEDICSLAEDKRAMFIIIPFHKSFDLNEAIHTTNPMFHRINQNVLENAPCSVGLLVEQPTETDDQSFQNIAVIFIGGSDNREALALAWRMVGHPGVTVTLIRFIQSDTDTTGVLRNSTTQSSPCNPEPNRQQRLDDNYVNEFRLMTSGEESVNYEERTLNNVEETIETLKTIDRNYDLYIVGRGEGFASPLTFGLLDWSDCPELGAIGDLLVGSDHINGSVLVVQQYIAPGSKHGIYEDSMRNNSILNDSIHNKDQSIGSSSMHSKSSFTDGSLSRKLSLAEVMELEKFGSNSSRFGSVRYDDDDDDDDEEYD